jgi:molecular chaperone GrpE
VSEEKKDEFLEDQGGISFDGLPKEETTNEETQVENEFETLEEKVVRLENELKLNEEKFLRAYADFENMKKRLEREKYQAIDYASEKFAKDLLVPLDTLEMALNSANADIDANELLKKLKEGIELTIKNFLSTFEKHHITKVETDGEFDPNVHNAVMKVDSENHDSGQIVSELQKGYLLKDRLLRPSMVSIAN